MSKKDFLLKFCLGFVVINVTQYMLVGLCVCLSQVKKEFHQKN